MTDDLKISPRLTIPGSELVERFSRSSGPGGQSVNTSDTRVELSFDLARSPALPGWLRHQMRERLAGRLVDGVLTVVAAEYRSQLANRRAARDRLGRLLADAAAPPPAPRRPTRPTREAHEARLADKRRRGEIKRGRSRSYGD